jgi:autotransporter-associated beta strand protein
MKTHSASSILRRPSIRSVASALFLMMTGPLWAAPPAQFTTNITRGAETITVDYLHHPLRGANFQVLMQDAAGALNPVAAPEARTYIGTVAGYPGASACALLQPDGTRWEYVIFEAGDQWWADNGNVIRTYGSKTFTPTWPTSAVVTPAQAATVNYVVAGDMIAEIPYATFTGRHGSNVDHVVYVNEFCLMQTNLIYLRDIGFLHRMSRMIIRASQPNDPFRTGDPLQTLRGLDGPYVGHEALKYVTVPGFGGGVALLGTVGDFYSGVSVNDTDGRGDAFIYFRHEVGHNHGSGDGQGGYCENYTLLNANQVGRLSGPEEAAMIASRHGGPAYGADVMENMGSYSAFSLPPRASLDLANAEPGTPITIDVMANDHDSNGDTYTLLSFDSVSTRGATITRSVGTGPGGRDQIIFTGANGFPSGLDNFQYRIVDSTGRQALGNVYVKVALGTTGELAAHWALDETTGTTAGNAAGTAAATLYNGAGWVAGTINNGLSFNGVNQHAKATINIPESNTAVSFWFKTAQAGGGLYSVVDNGTGHDRHIYLNAGNIKARIWSEETIASTGQNYADDQWHQVVHTFGGVAGGQKLYVDGVLVASGTKTSSNFTTQTAIELGYSASSSPQYFNGQLDEVRIWNRALTAAEALALAQRSGTADDPAPPYAAIVAGSQGPTSLEWLAPTGATSHDVYFGTYAGVRDATTASSEFQGNFTTASFVPTITTPGVYYWRVDERRDTSVFKGAVWYFQYIGTNGSNAYTLTQPTAWWVEGSGTFTQTGVINGSGSLYKDRTGTLVLTAADNYTGTTTVNQGVLTLGIGGSLPNTSAITIASGATLNLSGTANNEIFAGTQTGILTVGGTLAVTTNAANTLYCNNIMLNNGTVTSSGGNGGQAATYGAFFVGASRTIVANGSGNFISGNGDLGIGGSSILTLNTPLSGDSLVASTRFKLTGSLAKAGLGTVTLSGANTYTGATTVNSGTLSLTGSLAATATTVLTGATLGGTGTTAGAVTVQSGGTLAPGVNATGTLTVNNALTLSGTAAMEIGRTGSVLSTDKVSGVSTLTYGGNLVVTNIGGDALLAGDTFQLFFATTRTGNFGSITLPSLSPGLMWETGNLSVNGSIRVGASPLAVNDNVTTAEDTAGTFSVMANDYDPDGDIVSLVSVTQGANGSVAISGNNVTYTPAANYHGSDSFTYTVTDSDNGTATATVSVTVTAVNDAPVFIVDPILAGDAEIGTAYTGQTLAGKVTDVDAGDSITYSKFSGPAWLSVAPNGALSGTPPAGSTGLNNFVVRATDGFSAIDDAELRINVLSLPLPWTKGDIGTGMLAGSTSHSSGTFTEAGSGALGGTSDKLQFAYQALTGDGEIIARISVLQNTGNSSRVGVMIRDTLATNSKQIFMGMTSTGNYRWVRRSTTGGSNSTTNSSTGTVPNTWVRLVRVGSTITAYKSTNGSSWTSVGSTTVTMATNCYIGLAVSSGSNTTLNTSQFSNVSVTP